MADGKKEKEGGSTAALVVAAVIALAAGVGVAWLHRESARSEQELARAKSDHRSMIEKMRRPVEEYVRQRKTRAGMSDGGEDVLVFLDRKAREAQLAGSSIAPSQEQTAGAWKEKAYTVSARGTKEAPVRRQAVVDFLRKVEQERKSVKSKNLQLAFSGADFSSVTVTFSAFAPK